MYIKILGSGSAGNGYIIGDESEQIIVEAGMPYRRAEEALDFNMRGVRGLLVSHSHADHAGFLRQYIPHMKVYATLGTLTAKGAEQHPNSCAVSYGRPFCFGRFTALAFRTEHDAEEPAGFIIKLPDGSRMLFATDTYYLRNTFKGINHWLLECNYDDGILRRNVVSGEVNRKVAQRVRTSHMSLAQCIDTLKHNDLSYTKEIILIHLSSHNSSRKLFVDSVAQATGRLVVAAQKGLRIELL